MSPGPAQCCTQHVVGEGGHLGVPASPSAAPVLSGGGLDAQTRSGLCPACICHPRLQVEASTHLLITPHAVSPPRAQSCASRVGVGELTAALCVEDTDFTGGPQ